MPGSVCRSGSDGQARLLLERPRVLKYGGWRMPMSWCGIACGQSRCFCGKCLTDNRHTPPDSVIALPPSSTHVAWYIPGERKVMIQGLGKTTESCLKQPSQELRLPREIEWFGWRNSM